MIDTFTNTPIFGLLITVLAYGFGVYVYKRTHNPLFNPILIALGIIIPSLLIFKIPLSNYNQGGSIISFFLAPATVALAVPLFKQLELLHAHFVPIMIGTLVGVITSVTSCILLGNLFGLNDIMIRSSLPKSITTPIGMSLSTSVGGEVPITIVMIIFTGISGAILAPFVLKLFRIKNPVAKGIAIGTSSHGIGTSKAIEMGEQEGAMSGLAIGLTGLFTVFILPLLVKLFFAHG